MVTERVRCPISAPKAPGTQDVTCLNINRFRLYVFFIQATFFCVCFWVPRGILSRWDLLTRNANSTQNVDGGSQIYILGPKCGALIHFIPYVSKIARGTIKPQHWGTSLDDAGVG